MTPEPEPAAIADEFVTQMAAWRREHEGDPSGEMRRLLLLAMEREEIVSVAYAESFLAQRIARLDVPADVRDLVSQALLWTWRDEEMHAIYVRGVLLRRGGPLVAARAFCQQFGGAAGGWAASVKQHVPARSAPVSHALATLLTSLGVASGKVPKAVRPYLTARPFRDFCAMNVDAERTAEACWRRCLELGPDAGIPDDVMAHVARMADDERRHRLAFAAMGRALDASDRLVSAEAAATLRQDIQEIGEAFLPRRLRRDSAPTSLGAGGRVVVARRAEAESARDLVRRCASDAGLAEILSQRSRERSVPVAELRVVIRPSFMFSCDAADLSSFTDPALAGALIETLRDEGVTRIRLLECRNIYDRFLARRTVADVAAALGFDRLGVPVDDAALEQEPHAYSRGLDQASIARSWRDADVRIGFGKLKTHPTSLLFGSLMSLQSLGTRIEDYLFPERRATHFSSILSVLDDFPPHFALLDAVSSAADGVAGILGCPDPPSPGRLYASRDALALDLAAARHAGIDDPLASDCLRAACHWFGDPRPLTEIVGTDEPIDGWRAPRGSEWRTLLGLLAWPAYSYASSRGAIFVPVVDERAFPPLAAPSRRLRLARAAVHRLLGLSRHA